MTCIVGVEYPGGIVMGGDRAAVAGTTVQPVAYPKVFQRGQFLIGYAASYRMGQLLQYKLAPERQSPKQDDMEYLCTTFIDHVRNLFDANGLGGEDDRGAISGGVFLVGYKAHLYEVHYEYQIFRSADGYAAIGSGQDFALGSLASTAYLLDPEKRVAVALRAAARHCVSVVSPYDTVVVNGV